MGGYVEYGITRNGDRVGLKEYRRKISRED